MTEIETLKKQLEETQRENTVLRGIVAKQVISCQHCGLEDMSKCASGFPGCSKADDIMCADAELSERFSFIAATAKAGTDLYTFLAENCGDNAEFPLKLTADADVVEELSSRLRLMEACTKITKPFTDSIKIVTEAPANEA